MYYPESQLITNLYSNGGLQYKDSSSPYIGYYYATVDNTFFTGRYPGDGPNIELTNLILNNIGTDDSEASEIDYRFRGNDNYTYSQLKNITATTLQPQPPISSYPKPTQQNYETGEFTRYFAKKVNENIYIETQNLFQSSLYIGFSIPWLIIGDINNVAQVNQRIVALKEAELKIIGLGLYLKNNYLQFYK